MAGTPKPKNSQQQRGDAAGRANRMVQRRTYLLMILLGIVIFLPLFWKLYDLQIVQHEELQSKAVAQQTRSSVISASRGTIYDSTGEELAYSATAENVCISPLDIQSFMETQDSKIAEGTLSASDKRDKEYIARGLARILDMDADDILTRMENTSIEYEVLMKKADQSVADEVREFINGTIDDEGNPITEMNADGVEVTVSDPITLRGIFLEPTSKRYYPKDTLAAQVIGFVNGDNEGATGLEAKYDSILQGTSGMTVTLKSLDGIDLLFQGYEKYYDAENGKDLYLTLDSTLQYYLEQGIESMIAKFQAANGATGIIMNPKTGAILAMASYPTFNLNDYSEIYDTNLQASLASQLSAIEAKQDTYEDEEAYEAAISDVYSTLRNKQWRNRCLSDTYEPGSTFKPITLSTALEVGAVTMNSTFYCGGSINVAGWSTPIYCSNHSGHGSQTLQVATGNSCNPAFITIGLSVGTETYYQYLKSFGLMESTGIDLPGEVSSGIFASEDNFNSNVVSLACYAFGQTFNITPLQLIRAQAACINGGYLVTPYVVDRVQDSEGNIIAQHTTDVVRQVVSEETSANVRECLEYVVASGTGKNGQVAGYRVGGKTGTADKTGNVDNEIVVSFMCFAPADDPQVIMLMTLDTPSRTTGTYPSGGNMVAPTASSIMSEVLPYLGIQPDYTSSDFASVEVTVPSCVGESLETAKAMLSSAGFAYKTIGDGDTVTDQTPAGGAIVPNSATILLYMGAEKPTDACVVPNVIGMTAAEANTTLTNAGLIMRAAGTTSTTAGNVHAISQSESEGTLMDAGSVITVQFGDNSVLD